MLESQKKLTNGFYALVSLPATAMGFALSVQISALSWLLSTKFHLDIHQVGLVWAAGPLAGIFGQVIVGLVSDKVWFWGGRRRPFILIGGTLAALMLFLLPRIGGINAALGGLLGANSLLIVATMVALTLDLAINVSFNPTRSLIADVTPEGEARTKGFTWMQTISGFWGVVAYLVGVMYGNENLILIGMVVVLLFSILPALLVSEPRDLGPTQIAKQDVLPEPPISTHTEAAPLRASGKAWPRVRSILTVRMAVVLRKIATLSTVLTGQVGRIYIAHAFSWVGVQTMFVFGMYFIMQEFPAGGRLMGQEFDAQVGRILSIAFFVMNLVGFVFPGQVLEPLARRFGRVRTHAAALAFMALGYFGIAAMVRGPLGPVAPEPHHLLLFGERLGALVGVLLADGPQRLLLLMAVVGIGWGAVVSLPFAILSDQVERTRMGLFMGVFNLSIVLPQLFVSIVVSKVVQVWPDKAVVFRISGASLAVSALLWLLVREPAAPPADSSSPATQDPALHGGH